jgi:hypothetical protein
VLLQQILTEPKTLSECFWRCKQSDERGWKRSNDNDERLEMFGADSPKMVMMMICRADEVDNWVVRRGECAGSV